MSRDDRPNWREIDKRKDRSKHRDPDARDMPAHRKVRAESASMMYKAQLDSFFSGEAPPPKHVRDKVAALPTSKEGKERKAALDAIAAAKTGRERDKAVAAYLDRWELPPDYGVYQELLRCTDEDYIEMALEGIAALIADNRPPKRKALLEERLKSLAMLADDPDISERCTQLARQLRAFP